MSGTATAKLSTWVAESPAVPAGSLLWKVATTHIADTVAVMIAGASSRAVAVLQGMNDDRPLDGPALTVFGTSADARTAALVNGAAAHVLDFDDFEMRALIGHPSAVVLPAVLAVAQESGASLGEFVSAYAIGVEVAIRVGELVNPDAFLRSWATTPVVGVVGATAGCGRLIGLDSATTEMALGIAASLASGLKFNVGSMTKALHTGNAAAQAVLAVRLAARGYDAMPNFLQAEGGFAEAVAGRPVGEVPGTWPADREPALTAGDIWLKQYPSCGATHAPIDALRDILATGLDPRSITQIMCEVPPHALNVLPFRVPSTGLEGKFSLPYCLAVTAKDGLVTARHFDERLFRLSADVSDLITCTSMSLAADWDADGYVTSQAPVGARVSVLAGGETHRAERIRPAWSSASEIDPASFAQKVQGCLRDRLSAPETNAWIDGLSSARADASLELLTMPLAVRGGAGHHVELKE
jgi:2-methylcitrate dehydratase PrpD